MCKTASFNKITAQLPGLHLDDVFVVIGTSCTALTVGILSVPVLSDAVEFLEPLSSDEHMARTVTIHSMA